MGLLQKLKSTLGLGGSRSRRPREGTGEVDVRVEHEPEATNEAAVKGTDDGWDSPSAETDDGAGAAEPSTDDEPDATESASEDAADEAADEPATEDGDGSAGADVPVDELSGIGPAYAERLGEAGVESVADLADADAADVAADSDIAESRLEGWIEQAREY